MNTRNFRFSAALSEIFILAICNRISPAFVLYYSSALQMPKKRISNPKVQLVLSPLNLKCCAKFEITESMVEGGRGGLHPSKEMQALR